MLQKELLFCRRNFCFLAVKYVIVAEETFVFVAVNDLAASEKLLPATLFSCSKRSIILVQTNFVVVAAKDLNASEEMLFCCS